MVILKEKAKRKYEEFQMGSLVLCDIRTKSKKNWRLDTKEKYGKYGKIIEIVEKMNSDYKQKRITIYWLKNKITSQEEITIMENYRYENYTHYSYFSNHLNLKVVKK